jgi:hypothetical protein
MILSALLSLLYKSLTTQYYDDPRLLKCRQNPKYVSLFSPSTKNTLQEYHDDP